MARDDYGRDDTNEGAWGQGRRDELDDRTRDWRGPGPGIEWQARRGELPPMARGWRDDGPQRADFRSFDDRSFDARRRRDPHAAPDDTLYGGEQAVAQPGPYHGGYSTMERLARDEGPGGMRGGAGDPGDFSTEGFNAGDLGPRGEYRETMMRGAVSEIGYNEARMGRPRLAGDQASARPSYAGRGPRGYRRSDERIREDICEALTHHPEIDARELEVEVQGGEVTLSGSVDHRRTKRLVEDLAERCSGVHDVHNHLRVGGGGRDQDDSPYRST